MDDADQQISLRLDRVATRWTLVLRAGDTADPNALEARRLLVLRYAPAIRSYVAALVRDEELADELAHEIVLRLLQGQFRGADPARGRFRDYLKVAIKNAVRNYWRRAERARTAQVDIEQAALAQEADESTWLSRWRNNLLEVCWDRLREYEQQHPGNIYYAVLRARTRYPEASSQELAEKLAVELQRPIRPDAVRQTLKRARAKFAEFLIDEVADGLADPTPQRIEEELVALGLYAYVKEFVPRASD